MYLSSKETIYYNQRFSTMLHFFGSNRPPSVINVLNLNNNILKHFHLVLNDVYFAPEEIRTGCKHVALLGVVDYNELSLTVNNTNYNLSVLLY